MSKHPHPWTMVPVGPMEWAVNDANGVQLFNLSEDEEQFDGEEVDDSGHFINVFSEEMATVDEGAETPFLDQLAELFERGPAK
jgi:hypothetical protein